MFDDAIQFYPTPKALAFQLFNMAGGGFGKILEPSAGKGDLIEHYAELMGERRRNKIKEMRDISDEDAEWYAKEAQKDALKKVEAIELNADLQKTLEGKGIKVIADDFLAYNDKTQYDTIIMNPPFRYGADHVMKAWHTLFDGQVLAIVNAETIRNPNTRIRQELVNTIEEHGRVEFVQNAFSDAERKTDVEVALVYLRKKGDVAQQLLSGVAEDLQDDYMRSEGEDKAKPKNNLAIHGRSIENTVLAYDKAVEFKIKAILASQEAHYFSNLLVGRGTETDKMTDVAKKSINEAVAEIRKKAWEYVVYGTDFAKITTSKVRKEIEAEAETYYTKAFTASNIRTFMISLMERQGAILTDCIVEVFDMFTKYHDGNRVHIEGWKSNDYFLVGKKVVLPYAIDCRWGNAEVSWGFQEKLMDIERALSHCDKGILPEKPAAQCLKEAQGTTGLLNRVIDSQYFSIRCYKKGTIHLMFKDPDILNRFNLMAARGKGWLKEGDPPPAGFNQLAA